VGLACAEGTSRSRPSNQLGNPRAKRGKPNEITEGILKGSAKKLAPVGWDLRGDGEGALEPWQQGMRGKAIVWNDGSVTHWHIENQPERQDGGQNWIHHHDVENFARHQGHPMQSDAEAYLDPDGTITSYLDPEDSPLSADEIQVKVQQATGAANPWHLGASDFEYICPHCGSDAFVHHRGYVQCRSCGMALGIPGDENLTAIPKSLQPETLVHPDPWMDNEPGSMTFPESWHLGGLPRHWIEDAERAVITRDNQVLTDPGATDHFQILDKHGLSVNDISQWGWLDAKGRFRNENEENEDDPEWHLGSHFSSSLGEDANKFAQVPGLPPWKPGYKGKAVRVNNTWYAWPTNGWEPTHWDAMEKLGVDDPQAVAIVSLDGNLQNAPDWIEDDDDSPWRLTEDHLGSHCMEASHLGEANMVKPPDQFGGPFLYYPHSGNIYVGPSGGYHFQIKPGPGDAGQPAHRGGWSPEYGVTWYNPRRQDPEIHRQVSEAFGGPSEDSWKLGAGIPQYESGGQQDEWEPGNNGKGLIAPDGTIYTWSGGERDGEHHFQMMEWIESQGKRTPGFGDDNFWDLYDQSRGGDQAHLWRSFFIFPRGRIQMAQGAQPGDAELAQAHVNNLMRGSPYEDEWHLGSHLTSALGPGGSEMITPHGLDPWDPQQMGKAFKRDGNWYAWSTGRGIQPHHEDAADAMGFFFNPRGQQRPYGRYDDFDYWHPEHGWRRNPVKNELIEDSWRLGKLSYHEFDTENGGEVPKDEIFAHLRTVPGYEEPWKLGAGPEQSDRWPQSTGFHKDISEEEALKVAQSKGHVFGPVNQNAALGGVSEWQCVKCNKRMGSTRWGVGGPAFDEYCLQPQGGEGYDAPRYVNPNEWDLPQSDWTNSLLHAYPDRTYPKHGSHIRNASVPVVNGGHLVRGYDKSNAPGEAGHYSRGEMTTEPWQPGMTGKAIVVGRFAQPGEGQMGDLVDPTLHIWKTDLSEYPHHTQVTEPMRKFEDDNRLNGRIIDDLTFGPGWTIRPDGSVERPYESQYDHLLPDRLHFDDGQDWHLGSSMDDPPEVIEVGNEVNDHGKHDFGTGESRPVLYHPKQNRIYVGQPWQYHWDLVKNHPDLSYMKYEPGTVDDQYPSAVIPRLGDGELKWFDSYNQVPMVTKSLIADALRQSGHLPSADDQWKLGAGSVTGPVNWGEPNPFATTKGLILNDGTVRAWAAFDDYQHPDGSYAGHHIGHPEYGQAKAVFVVSPVTAPGSFAGRADIQRRGPDPVSQDEFMPLVQQVVPWAVHRNKLRPEGWDEQWLPEGNEWKFGATEPQLGYTETIGKAYKPWGTGAFNYGPRIGSRPVIYDPQSNFVGVGPVNSHHGDIEVELGDQLGPRSDWAYGVINPDKSWQTVGMTPWPSEAMARLEKEGLIDQGEWKVGRVSAIIKHDPLPEGKTPDPDWDWRVPVIWLPGYERSNAVNKDDFEHWDDHLYIGHPGQFHDRLESNLGWMPMGPIRGKVNVEQEPPVFSWMDASKGEVPSGHDFVMNELQKHYPGVQFEGDEDDWRLGAYENGGEYLEPATRSYEVTDEPGSPPDANTKWRGLTTKDGQHHVWSDDLGLTHGEYAVRRGIPFDDVTDFWGFGDGQWTNYNHARDLYNTLFAQDAQMNQWKLGMAVDPMWLQEWIKRNPHAYHETSPYSVQGIEQEGIRYDPDRQDMGLGGSAPDYNYLWTPSDEYQHPKAQFRVDLSKLDPSKIEFDADWANALRGEHADLANPIDDPENGWDYSTIHQYVAEHPEYQLPQNVQQSMEHGTVAYKGDIPPEAIERNPAHWTPENTEKYEQWARKQEEQRARIDAWYEKMRRLPETFTGTYKAENGKTYHWDANGQVWQDHGLDDQGRPLFWEHEHAPIEVIKHMRDEHGVEEKGQRELRERLENEGLIPRRSAVNEVQNGNHHIENYLGMGNSFTTRPWQKGYRGKLMLLNNKLHMWATERPQVGWFGEEGYKPEIEYPDPHHDGIYDECAGPGKTYQDDNAGYMAAPKGYIAPDGKITNLRARNHMFDQETFDQIAAMHPDLYHTVKDEWDLG
jgi:hypothetical protein